MKATGIVRKLDPLGRIVIPKELRDTLEIKHEDPVEIFVDGQDIILRKYEPFCVFCGETGEIVNFEGKKLCKKCIKKISKL